MAKDKWIMAPGVVAFAIFLVLDVVTDDLLYWLKRKFKRSNV